MNCTIKTRIIQQIAWQPTQPGDLLLWRINQGGRSDVFQNPASVVLLLTIVAIAGIFSRLKTFFAMRMTRRLLFLFAGLLLATLAQAQMERTMYQVFEVDSVKGVQLEILDIYELHSWAGNSILVETNVQISNASPEILDFLIKNGRYDVKMDTLAPGQVKLYTKIKDRKTVKTPDGECTELPMAKIFVPDTFLWSEDKKSITRKAE